MSIGGGCSAEILASRIGASDLLTSSTMAAAESFGPRSDQSLRLTNACAVFWPWPRKLKQVRNVPLSTPERFLSYASTLCTALAVRLNEESDGVCTSTVRKPWSSTGRKPPGRRMNASVRPASSAT